MPSPATTASTRRRSSSSRPQGRPGRACRASPAGPGRTAPLAACRPPHRRDGRLRARRVWRAKPARHVVAVTAAAHEDPARPSLQVQDCHLCGIEAARHRGDREQHGPTTRQPLRPEKIGFALRTVGSGENGRRPGSAATRCRPVACVSVATMIVSSGPQVAPRGRPSSVDSVIAGPPVSDTFLNVLPLSMNPIHCPSGETNGPRGAPVNTATGSRASSARTKSCVPLLPT